LIQQKLADAGYVYRVVNAGVSGDTTQDGLQRLDWVLRQPVDVFVLALGANDALRGQPIDHIEGNLDAILSGTRARYPDVQLVLAGMRMPLNYGPAYTRSFERMYRDLARRHDAVLIPFLLDGVAGRPDLNLRDGIHPTEEGQRIIADTVWTYLRPAVR
jgi:acyl-CoA thioesterase-1